MSLPTRIRPIRSIHSYYIQCRQASTHQPPDPRPYKAAPRIPGGAQPNTKAAEARPADASAPLYQPRTGILRYIWPFSKGIRIPPPPASSPPPQPEAEAKAEPPDLARAQEAANKVVRTGELDEKYKAAARRVTAIICALPIVIGVGWELWRRRFGGAEQKRLPKVKRQEELR